ncbi:class I SAM-dependent methyltransferase [Actinokineospora sp. NBRC 105648]|uniref:class I SAM-dependent methyltransferase n=1 Tax=Actinokineospora sp. NBRC 105648 TaxID=3032206 RepID=UPI0024A1867F|nr:class I SAM-dependent methyltransferase [Actinokineospora sp. NBRC 105648]GLZ40215.1 hypothetical protein Acsp05_38390 [Actinokineospora sp. NBRC 105648]
MDLHSYYTSGTTEHDRLYRTPHGRLELLRTKEIIRRDIPARARVLDVGGGTGAHAEWLAADGHSVHVIDPVPAHVEAAASLPGVTASVGDAREPAVPTGSVDVVLLFGPLYHLCDVADRRLALAEAARVLRPGGVLFAAAISRCLTLLETGSAGRLSAELAPRVAEVLATGAYDGHVGFVPAHFHDADELGAEVAAGGFTDVAVYGVEGPVWPTLDALGDNGFARMVDAAARCARLVERDPRLIAASAHLIATGSPRAAS